MLQTRLVRTPRVTLSFCLGVTARDLPSCERTRSTPLPSRLHSDDFSLHKSSHGLRSGKISSTPKGRHVWCRTPGSCADERRSLVDLSHPVSPTWQHHQWLYTHWTPVRDWCVTGCTTPVIPTFSMESRYYCQCFSGKDVYESFALSGSSRCWTKLCLRIQIKFISRYVG